MGKEWIKLKETGQLYLEKVLVSFDIPILFVCVDYENRKYLCLNIDEETGKSVIAATDNKHIIAMLKNEKTMDSVFRDSIEQKIIVAEYDFEKEEIFSYSEDSMSIPADMLPKENEYFELSNKEIEEYISFLEKQQVKIQNETFSNETFFTISPICFDSDFNVEDKIAYICEKVIVAETKNKCLYDVNTERRLSA